MKRPLLRSTFYHFATVFRSIFFPKLYFPIESFRAILIIRSGLRVEWTIKEQNMQTLVKWAIFPQHFYNFDIATLAIFFPKLYFPFYSFRAILIIRSRLRCDF